MNSVIALLAAVAVGIVIYLLSLERTPPCTCPRLTVWNQDRTRTVVKIRHLSTCEARHE